MGCDVWYYCESAEREPVERLISLVKRWAIEEGYCYTLVNIENCELHEKEPWRRPDTPQELALVCEIFGKKLADPMEELEASYAAECDYLRRCRQGVDLYGISVDAAWENTGQFIFDFRANGKLVSCTVHPEHWQASNRIVACSDFRIGCDWRGFAHVLPRFLAWCKIRYLPQLEFGDSRCVYQDVIAKFYEDELERMRIASMDEELFYTECVRPGGIFV